MTTDEQLGSRSTSSVEVGGDHPRRGPITSGFDRDPRGSVGRWSAIVVEEDDRGDIFSSRGHHDAHQFVHAVIAYLAEYDSIGEVMATIRASGGRNALIGRVRHGWRPPDSGPTKIEPAGDGGVAQPWTTLTL